MDCDACGFREAAYDRPDLVSTLRVIGPMLQAAIDNPLGDPGPERSVVADYAAALERRCVELLGHLGAPANAAPQPDTVGDVTWIDAQLVALSGAMGAVSGVSADAIDRALLSIVHDGVHAVFDIGRVRPADRPAESGWVAGLFVSDGGVPKRPVDVVEVSPLGIVGDRQDDRRNHGRPFQAVCLWSADVVDRLVAEGHPIVPGSAGENISVRGVDWAALRPGSAITIGPVGFWVTAHAIPCTKNAQWFADRDHRRILHTRHPGDSRLYAIPLTTGHIRPNDPILTH